MLQVSLWVRILTAVILLGGILIALPNALPDKVLAKFPKWLPSHTVNLGLDLQGGSYLLLQVDFDQVTRDRAEAMVGDIRAAFRKARIPLTDLNTRNDIVSVRVTDPTRIEEARTLLQSLNPVMGSSVLAVGGKQYDLSEPGNGGFVLRMTDAFKTLTRQQVLDQSIEVVRRRIDELGTREPSIERSGEDRILVQVPGLQDPGQLKEILGKTAKMTFQLVDEQANPNATVPPIGSEILPMMRDEQSKNLPVQKIAVHRRVMVSGDRLTDAGTGFDQQTGEPVVTFRFDSVGARQFGEVTKENVNHRFAIVLDQEVITAPNIISPILGGSGQITGSFTTAADRAALLAGRAGVALSAAGAAQHHRRAHRRRRTGRGLGEGRPLCRVCRPRHGGAVHDPALWPFWPVRQRRFGHEHCPVAGCTYYVRGHPDLARHRRYCADHGHGGGRPCPDL